MNPVIKNILARRSVRTFNAEKKIAKKDLNLILKAGLYAPSGCNAQPWHFTVIENKAVRAQINEETKKELLSNKNPLFVRMGKNKNFEVFYNAPAVVIVSFTEEKASSPYIDIAAASQNMLLAAKSLGIASCWIGVVTFMFLSREGAKYTKILNLPEGYKPLYALVFGYPKQKKSVSALARKSGTVNYLK